MERYHRIFGHEVSGISRFQGQLDLLAEKKSRVGNAVAHFDEIFDCHVGDGVCVYFSRLFKFMEHTRPVGAVTVEQFHKKGTVFEAAVQSLAKERHDRMSRIPEQKQLPFDVPRRALDRNHASGRVGKVVVRKLRHKEGSIGKVSLEELTYVGASCKAGKTVRTFKWQEQDARERPINIWQRDQHIVSAWPNVKCILVQ